jgi:hypothetical protein
VGAAFVVFTDGVCQATVILLEKSFVPRGFGAVV